MQLADLVARPIGLQVSIPQQPNRAFDLLARKFYCGGVVPKREAASAAARKRMAPVKPTEAVTPTGFSQST